MTVYDEVVVRLAELGYTVPAGQTQDASVLSAINRASDRIKANINRTEIPEGLKTTLVDMSAGLFLYDKRAAGGLAEAFDFSCAKRITEGDVSVEYADGAKTPEARFDDLLDRLINPPPWIFARFRRVAW